MKKFLCCSAFSLSLAMTAATPTLANGENTLRFIFTQCGLGGIIAPGGAAAAIINLLFSSPTATTQGLVVPDSCAGGAASRAQFMSLAHDELLTEIAIGDGEYLDALLDHTGCSAAARPEVVADLRSILGEMASSDALQQDNSAEELFVQYHLAVDGQCAPAG